MAQVVVLRSASITLQAADYWRFRAWCLERRVAELEARELARQVAARVAEVERRHAVLVAELAERYPDFDPARAYAADDTTLSLTPEG